MFKINSTSVNKWGDKKDFCSYLKLSTDKKTGDITLVGKSSFFGKIVSWFANHGLGPKSFKNKQISKIFNDSITNNVVPGIQDLTVKTQAKLTKLLSSTPENSLEMTTKISTAVTAINNNQTAAKELKVVDTKVNTLNYRLSMAKTDLANRQEKNAAKYNAKKNNLEQEIARLEQLPEAINSKEAKIKELLKFPNKNLEIRAGELLAIAELGNQIKRIEKEFQSLVNKKEELNNLVQEHLTEPLITQLESEIETLKTERLKLNNIINPPVVNPAPLEA